MIFDSIRNYKLYSKLSPQIENALKIAVEMDFEKIKDGKYEVDSDNLYYLVQRYKTKPIQEKIETHKKYIDIQLIAKGNEQIGYAAAENLKVHTPYDEEKEVVFFYAPDDTTFLKMSKGDFAIFWPSDAHMPGCQMNEPEDVLKVVFKIRI